jgi:hypothetical protein
MFQVENCRRYFHEIWRGRFTNGGQYKLDLFKFPATANTNPRTFQVEATLAEIGIKQGPKTVYGNRFMKNTNFVKAYICTK